MKKSLHVFLNLFVLFFINITFSYSNNCENIYSFENECIEDYCEDQPMNSLMMDPLVVSLVCPATSGSSGNETASTLVSVAATTAAGMGSITFPSDIYSTIPPEATDINVSLTIDIESFGASWLSELIISTDAPGTFADATNFQPSLTDASGTETYTLDYGDEDPSGLWDFTMFETTNDVGIDSEVSLEVSLTWTVPPLASDCDTIVCDATSFVLDTELPGLTYNWSTMESTQSITVTESGTYSVTISDGIETATDDIVVIFGASSETVDANICDGQTYTVGTSSYTMSGVYTDVFTSSTGCDSTVITHLTVANEIEITVDTIICFGESYIVGTSTYTMSGNFTDVLMSALGCDSIVNTNLTILPEINSLVDTLLCFGDTYEIVANDGTSNLDTPGTYTFILTSEEGCDSNVTVLITVLDEIMTEEFIQICNGETYEINGNSYTLPGDYTNILSAGIGCDSTVLTHLNVVNQITEEVTLTICDGQSITVGTSTYNTTGDYVDMLTSVSGCDSIVSTYLTVAPIYELNNVHVICNDQVLIIGTNTYTVSGLYSDTLMTDEGCDSIIHSDLTILPEIIEENTIELCFNGSITVAGNVYDTTGDYTDIVPSSLGCDSTIITHLTILNIIEETINAEICPGQAYVIGTSSYTSPGTYTDILQASNNCDSIVTLNLSFSAPSEQSNFIQICNGQTYTEGSSTYSSSGTYTDIYTTPEGCDSTVTTVLNVVAQIDVTQDISICDGSSLTVGMNTYNMAGIYTDVLIASGGCDSVVTTNLTIIFDTPFTQEISICSGEFYSIGSSSYSVDGIYTDILTSSLGCDSTVITFLTVIGNSSFNNDVQICAGDIYTIGTSTYTNSGVYTDILVSSLGCDSTVITDLTVVDVINTSESVSLCEGESFEGVVYNASTTLVNDAQSVNGCDSIHTVTIIVSVDLEIDFIIQDDICENGQGSITAAVFGGIAPYSYTWDSSGTSNPFLDDLAAGSYILTVTDANNCSVIGTATVSSSPAITIDYSVMDLACNGDDNGAIDITVLTGTAPYLFIWSGPSNFSSQSEDISNLVPGLYTVIIYDANGCGFGTSIEVAEPGPLEVDVITYAGTAIASVTGGTAPYQYFWSNGATTPSLIDIATGNYFVTIEDSNGCSTAGEGSVLFNTGITSIENLLSFNILPNPSNGRFILDLEMSISTSLEVNIYSLAGINVYQNSFDASSIHEAIDLSHESSGTYLLMIDDGRNRKVEKIIIIK